MIESISTVKQHFERTLDQRSIRTTVPGGEWPWLNIRWQAPNIRWAHLEEYTMTPKVHILHLVIMPSLDRAAPIYGFDLIGLNDQLTGLFIDFTPTVNHAPPPTTHQFCDPRPRPPWCDFFSDNFVCARPHQSELVHAQKTLDAWLEILDQTVVDQSIIEQTCQSQKNYCVNQQKNDKTKKMLKAHIGEQRAKQFVEQVLFPASELEC